MKQTRVRYQKVSDDKIKIVDIESAASESELEYEFGTELVDKYLRNAIDGPAYVSRFNKTVKQWEVQIYFKFPNGGSIFMRPGIIMPKRHFSKAITTMKDAGDRLLRLQRKQKEEEIKEIVI